MKVYKIIRKQFLPIDMATAWDFFSSPANLGKITPKEFDFKITSMSGGNKMYAGQIITYTITTPLLVKMNWVTEISHVSEPNFFTDEQRSGPFALWHHKHHFRETHGGIEMTDEVDYAPPLGWLGRLAHFIFVGREVNRIFDHRFKILEEHFRADTK